MMQITPSAEGMLRQIRQDADFPETAAVRIAPIGIPEGRMGIGFAFTDGPEDDDQVLSTKLDFRVFLSGRLAETLAEAALDATSNEEGITLELRTQAELHEQQGGWQG